MGHPDDGQRIESVLNCHCLHFLWRHITQIPHMAWPLCDTHALLLSETSVLERRCNQDLGPQNSLVNEGSVPVREE